MSTTAEKDFNLLDAPWILVRRGTEVREVSLTEVFRVAHEVDALACELATVDVALLRLLLAVLYASLAQDIASHTAAIERWKALYARGQFPFEKIQAYLESHRERFYLIHSETPFYQVANLRTSDGRVNPIAQIIADVPSRAERRIFSELSGEAVQWLSYPQAARWLVHLQAWDYAGKKASVVGGAPNGGGPGWLGRLGIVYAAGKNLFDTLMLNFSLNDDAAPITVGKPAWEEPPRTAAKVEATPSDYISLLTLQSRRAMLVGGDGRVTGIISSYGDVFDKENKRFEQMSGWHESSVKNQGYIPNTHSAERAMWRDLGAILPRRNADTGKNKTTTYRPAFLNFLSAVVQSEAVNLCAVGYEYGAMMGVVDTMISDALTVNAALLGEKGLVWADRITELLQCTDDAVRALGTLAIDLDKASGGTGEGVSRAAREQAYFALDNPFRIWLRNIDPDKPEEELDDYEADQMIRWRKTAKDIIRMQGEKLINAAGEKAYVGREIKNKKTDTGFFINAPRADMKFQAQLRKHLGKG